MNLFAAGEVTFEASTNGTWFVEHAWIVVLLPLISAALTLFLGSRTPGKGSVYGIVGVGAAFVFSLGGFVNAVFAKNFDQVSFIPTFILTPLTYLGGVFYSISMLPDWAERLSHANPILYMVNAFRFGFLGHSDVNVVLAFAVMVAALVALFALCVWLLDRGTGIRD